MEQHKARRNQLQNEEMFEPIEIDFGYEDAVAFDSDKGKLLLGDTGRIIRHKNWYLMSYILVQKSV